MLQCNKCGTYFDVSLALAARGEVGVAHCRVCPVDRVYAICERCANLEQVQQGPCPWCGARHLWQVESMLSLSSTPHQERTPSLPVDTSSKKDISRVGWIYVGGLLLVLSIIFVIMGIVPTPSGKGISTTAVPLLFIAGIAHFFVYMGLVYLIAKIFRGAGTFLAQCFMSLLVLVPFSIAICIVSALASWLSGWLSNLITLLGAILLPCWFVALCYVIGKEVHGFSEDKTFAIVSLPTLLGFITIFLTIFLIGQSLIK